jgi:hypothetical protein
MREPFAKTPAKLNEVADVIAYRILITDELLAIAPAK